MTLVIISYTPQAYISLNNYLVKTELNRQKPVKNGLRCTRVAPESCRVQREADFGVTTVKTAIIFIQKISQKQAFFTLFLRPLHPKR
ncbi:MAG: hypothetical protein IJJ41_07390 [Clostridia bacterium]|nr:hypothetical protein [Clostridia bacterium]